MSTIVCKFGGSSLADASGFRKAREILLADPQRRYVVPSAPGKRHSGDEKITDLLYRCYAKVEKGEDFSDIFEKIAARYIGIAEELGMDFDPRPLLEETKARILSVHTPDFVASRGEYLNGVLLSKFLGMGLFGCRAGHAF